MVKRAGFTLIELLVVIAIISLLASIVITSLGAARNKAHDAQGIEFARQFRTCVEAFHLDYNRYYGYGVPPESQDDEYAKFAQVCNTHLLESGEGAVEEGPGGEAKYKPYDCEPAGQCFFLEVELVSKPGFCWRDDTRGKGEIPDTNGEAILCTPGIETD